MNEERLTELIERITPQEIEDKSERALEWATNHTWEREEVTLLGIYRELIPDLKK
ncbi:MAG: hypothetical protein HQ591_07660 [candidate division Zixibacteria bacterium]|nr:hypothetical protein [Candidatus Tariuqbacter arcticus]